MRRELAEFAMDIDQPLREFARMRGRIADPFDAIDFGNVAKQLREIRRPAIDFATPCWLATQPPPAIISERLASLRCFTRPRSLNTFSSAFSRTEQVLKTMTSASSGVEASSTPCASRMTSAILCESYSFIWQPNV